MIRACVFDMDGLLLDSERQLYSHCGLETSEELGRPVSLEFLSSLMGGSWQAYRDAFLREYGEDYPIDEYMKRFWEKAHYIIDNVAIPLRPGVQEILDYCKEEGIRMAVATSSHREDVEKCLHNAGIADYFECIITTDDVEHTKPDPAIFLKAIAELGEAKEETLVFEDGHNGARAAVNGHCRLVLVEDLAYLDDEDRRYADLWTDNILNAIELIKRENEGTAGIQNAA